MRTTSPVRGALIHWVALMAMPTWLMTVGLRVLKMKIRSPALMASDARFTGVPSID